MQIYKNPDVTCMKYNFPVGRHIVFWRATFKISWQPPLIYPGAPLSYPAGATWLSYGRNLVI